MIDLTERIKQKAVEMTTTNAKRARVNSTILLTLLQEPLPLGSQYANGIKNLRCDGNYVCTLDIANQVINSYLGIEFPSDNPFLRQVDSSFFANEYTITHEDKAIAITFCGTSKGQYVYLLELK